MASAGGDVAGDDWDDFGIALFGDHTAAIPFVRRIVFNADEPIGCRVSRVLDYGQTGANASRRLIPTNAETDGG
jgi:hypothetical protein